MSALSPTFLGPWWLPSGLSTWEIAESGVPEERDGGAACWANPSLGRLGAETPPQVEEAPSLCRAGEASEGGRAGLLSPSLCKPVPRGRGQPPPTGSSALGTARTQGLFPARCPPSPREVSVRLLGCSGAGGMAAGWLTPLLGSFPATIRSTTPVTAGAELGSTRQSRCNPPGHLLPRQEGLQHPISPSQKREPPSFFGATWDLHPPLGSGPPRASGV